MIVVGVDGCTDGWVAVVVRDGHFAEARVLGTFREVLAAFGDAAAIAVDMPIGLPETGRRRADDEAKGYLGKRRSSVFYVPPRAAVEAADYPSALAACRSLGAKGLSKQSHAFCRKIMEVDACVSAGDRIYEVHPEVSFRALVLESNAAAESLPAKKTWNGMVLRRRLLEAAGVIIPAPLHEAGDVGADDVLDAAIAAWSAARIARGEAKSLPAEPERDARGRTVAIWY